MLAIQSGATTSTARSIHVRCMRVTVCADICTSIGVYMHTQAATEIVAAAKDKSTCELLSAGLQRAQWCSSADDKAWAMRDSFHRCCICLAIRIGISKGTPLFNAGRKQQCMQLYAAVGQECLRIGSTPPPGQKF
jgi:hypothetical protein